MQEKNDKLIDDIRTLFGEMDKRGTGKLTYEEYMEAVGGNEVIQTKFVTLGIEDDADELWNLIDMGNGEIAVSQFAAGANRTREPKPSRWCATDRVTCLRIISEETKAKDVFTINRRVGNAERSLDHS
ncbi:unnamed protein product, partial [Durusdinium trenchii]